MKLSLIIILLVLIPSLGKAEYNPCTIALTSTLNAQRLVSDLSRLDKQSIFYNDTVLLLQMLLVDMQGYIQDCATERDKYKKAIENRELYNTPSRSQKYTHQ